MADSPNAAEYISLYEISVATVSIRYPVKEMVLLTPVPVIYEDNSGARRLAMAGMGQNKANDLMTKHHYVQELCRDGKLIFEWVPMNEQPADLTKQPYTVATFMKLRDKLHIIDQQSLTL